MARTAKNLPVLSYSLSGFPALLTCALYIPVWIIVFIAISVVYTEFFDLVQKYHGGQILINLRHYAIFEFANFQDTNSLDYILQLKDIFELALPIALAYFTVIPIAVARSLLAKRGDLTAHIGFGQSELIVALNTIISYMPPFLFVLFISVLAHLLNNLITPPTHMVENFDGSSTPVATNSNLLHTAHYIFRALSLCIAAPLFVFTYVRTSLSLPFSLEQNRLGVLFSWRATRGLFWTVLKVEALAGFWALLICGSIYGLFVILAKTLFEKFHLVQYSISVSGEMDVNWFINLVIWSIIYTLFLILTFGPIVNVYRALRGTSEGEEAAADDA